MRRPALLLLFAVVLLSLFRTVIIDEERSELVSLAGSVQTVKGTVQSVRIRDGYAELTVRAGREKLLIRLAGDYCSPEGIVKIYSLVGREITAAGKLSLPQGRRNPGCFDYAKYLRGRGIYTLCSVSKYKLAGGRVKLTVLNILSSAKADFYAALIPFISMDSFGLLAGIMFGETGYLDEGIYEGFRHIGFAHILAVSGLHVSLTYEVIRKLIKRKDAVSDAVSLLFIALYTAMANFSVSVLRAAFMIALKLLAKNTDRRYDSVSAASAAASVFLIINPYRLYDSGMQLSFCAAYSMGIVAPWLETRIAELADRLESEKSFTIGKLLVPGAAAALGVSPLSCYQFLYFSPMAFLLNPAAILLAGYMLPAGLLCFALFIAVPPVLRKILMLFAGGVLEALADILLGFSEISNRLFGGFEVCAMPTGLVVCYYILFFFFFSETRYVLHRKCRYLELAAIEAFLIFIGSFGSFALGFSESVNPFDYGAAHVTFLDVGQGDCIHIHSGDTDILIDGGGIYGSNIAEKTLKPYLLKNGIKDIDLAIVTHSDMDHSLGIYQLAEIFELRQIVTNRDVYPDEYFAAGLSENDCCIVCSAEIDGLTFLFCADADTVREERLLISCPELSCNVIKIAHHGSAGSTGEAFIGAVNPSFAVISVGASNSYGHPSARVTELLDDSGIACARTDLSGAICLRRVTDKYYLFENAAKTSLWRINRQ